LQSHINTTSFSAVASQSINDVFSSTYDEYKIICNLVSNNDCDLTLRMRASGTDDSGNNYSTQRLTISSTTVTGVTGSASSVRLGNASTTMGITENLIANPFSASRTYFHGFGGRETEIEFAVGSHTLTNSYDGFTVIPTSGTITGSVKLYGLRK